MRFQDSRCKAKLGFAIIVTLLLAATMATQPSQAQKFKVLHTFHGKDGASPFGVLVRDTAGNLYGTTIVGGTGKCSKLGCGTAFKLNKTGKQVWLYTFEGKNGYGPAAGLLRDASGNLFGTTTFGGEINNHICSLGCGLIFKLDSAGKEETVLHKFTGPPDAYSPQSLLVKDVAGNLYGTTPLGGSGLGTVFKVDTTGKESVLYNFTGYSDGGGPYPGVILDSAGDLYGVANIGGSGFGNGGDGVVFKVDTSGNETVLHTFRGPDGANPDSVLLFDSEGDLYGTTPRGGSSQEYECSNYGCGVVFKLSPNADGSWTDTTLYNFCSQKSCADGEEPMYGPLVIDTVGNLYGTTYFGGTYDDGIVFKLDTAGTETVLHSFTGGSDGEDPVAGLVTDRKQNLYGTTEGGGATCSTPPSYTCGVVFKITP